MADTFTTNLNLTKPEVGASTDTWGTKLNADLDTLDAIFSASGTAINLGNVTVASLTTTGDINFGDNDKAVFGAGSDLQIYHDGSNSYIAENGTGDLYLKATHLVLSNSAGANYLVAYSGGSVNLYNNNQAKLSTTSTGIDVTGTVTADGLTVDGAATIDGGATDNTVLTLDSSTANTYLKITDSNSTNGTFIGATTDDLNFYPNNTLSAKFASGGDISFYDDTGTSQALFWDASAESLGIGTTSPSSSTRLHTIDTAADAQIIFETSHPSGVPNLQLKGAAAATLRYLDETGAIQSRLDFGNSGTFNFLDDSGNSHLKIDSSGNVGIGTASPSANLHVSSASGDCTVLIEAAENASGSEPRLQLKGTNTSSNPIIEFGDSAAFPGSIEYENSDNSMRLGTNSSERMRIDSSGNLLVGTTSTGVAGSSTNDGVQIQQSGAINAAVNNAPVAYFNRQTSDGDIVQFRKAGSTVGSIASQSGDLYIGGSDNNHAGLRFAASAKAVLPITNSTGALSDDDTNLGQSNARFDNIYATNGTIQTSDRNEKQDITELSDAEARVAVAAKGLLRKFRWQSAVEEKGDEARIHFGIIAQDLQDAFTAEGLDAGDYAMFISDTWTDDDGVEQTRLGVRYSELLAFIIAAI